MTKTLHADEWVTLTYDEGAGLVRYERSDRPYGSFADIDGCHEALTASASWLPRGLKLLIDIRRAPPRNDEGFETRVNKYLATLLPRFSGMSVLVKTAVGKLQTARLAAERGETAHVYDDEAQALAHLGMGVPAKG
jgi:hypothetical protein